MNFFSTLSYVLSLMVLIGVNLFSAISVTPSVPSGGISGKYIYVTTTGSFNNVYVYPATTPTLTANSQLSPSYILSIPNLTKCVTFSLNGTQAYIASALTPIAGSFSTAIYTINTTNLTQIGNAYTIPFEGVSLTDMIYVQGTTPYIYAVDTGNNVVWQIDVKKMQNNETTPYTPGYIYLGSGVIPQKIIYFSNGGILIVSTTVSTPPGGGFSLVQVSRLSALNAANGGNITNNSVVSLSSSSSESNSFNQPKGMVTGPTSVLNEDGTSTRTTGLFIANYGNNNVLLLDLIELLKNVSKALKTQTNPTIQASVQVFASNMIGATDLSIPSLGDKLYVLNSGAGGNGSGSIAVFFGGNLVATLNSNNNVFSNQLDPGILLSNPVGFVVLPSGVVTSGTSSLYGNMYVANNSYSGIGTTTSFRYTFPLTSRSFSIVSGYNPFSPPSINPTDIGAVTVPTVQQQLAGTISNVSTTSYQ